MSKHTPGPWEIDMGSVHGWTVYGPATDEHADPGGLTVVAEGARGPDARLIAAAPELLKALRMVRDTEAAFEALDFRKRDALLNAIAKATK